MAVATDNTVSVGVSMVKAPKVSTAPLKRNGTQTVNTLEPANKPKDIATLQIREDVNRRKQRFLKKNIVIFYLFLTRASSLGHI